MQIGLVSDTHDHINHVTLAVKLFKEHKVEQVIHAGDYVSPPSVKCFQGLNLFGILGNNDGEVRGLLKMFQSIGGTLKGDFANLELDKLNFGVYHGTEPAITKSLIQSQNYDVLVTGHTHQCMERQEGKTLILNPGSVHGFGQQGSAMIFDTSKKEITILQLGK